FLLFSCHPVEVSVHYIFEIVLVHVPVSSSLATALKTTGTPRHKRLEWIHDSNHSMTSTNTEWVRFSLLRHAQLQLPAAVEAQLVRYAVRMCAALASFFFIFMIMMFGVKSSRDARSSIQNGFWLAFFLIIIMLRTPVYGTV
ncbi:unnamed protein product, partial [Angiostrongylus costaricensis]|uniref:ABC2_membrane domain-containing protein n=1 Tax=Angiostrongylus costaricensis TaxID=334426 RepID=A0A158PM12_ANGCS